MTRASTARTHRRTVRPCRRGGPRPGRRSNRPRSPCPPRSWRPCPTRWIPYPSAHAAVRARCRAGRMTRPAASPVPDPRTTPSLDHQTMHGPRQKRVVTSPARCPLEPEDLSLKNFDLASSEGIIAYGAPPSHLSHRWIEAKEDAGEGATEKLRQYEIYRRMLADYFHEPADKA